jgi:hypothetical protein
MPPSRGRLRVTTLCLPKWPPYADADPSTAAATQSITRGQNAIAYTAGRASPRLLQVDTQPAKVSALLWGRGWLQRKLQGAVVPGGRSVPAPQPRQRAQPA